MRNKTLTSSMAGALLFGGTLGVTGAADAGLSWTIVSSAMFVGLDSVYATASGATKSSGGSWLSQSAATSNGISWSGSNVTGGARYFVLNAPEALDAPGEYWTNAAAGKMYWWPPSAAAAANASVTVADVPLIQFNSTADVWLEK